MSKWMNRDRKLKKRRSYKKQGRIVKSGNEYSSEQRKREIKQQQRFHRKNNWYEENIEEDEVLG